MNLKKYNFLRLIIVILLSSSISLSISLSNYLIPIFAVSESMVIIYILRHKVNEVIADERDYALAGQSARYTISIFGILMMIGVFVLLSLQAKNPLYGDISSILAYLTCFLMITNSLIFNFLKKKEANEIKGFKEIFKKYWIYFLIALILAFLFIVSTLRLFSGEDGWLCENGAWQKHGQPRAEMPESICR